MSGLINSVVEIGTFGLVDDITGTEAAQQAATQAAGVQSAAAEQGVAEQRRQFDIAQQQMQPFQQAGIDALNQQRILLGLGSQQPMQQGRPTSPTGAVQQAFGAISDLPKTQGQLGQYLGNLSGVVAGGTPPSSAQQQLSPQEQQAQAFAALNESPGQQFLRERAQKNLLRNAASIGGLGGGNVREALVQQGVGFAQQDLENQFSRLGQLAGQGQSATTNIGQFGAQTAGNIQQGLQQAAEARASGILGAGQVGSQFTSQLLGAGGQLLGSYLGR